MGETITISIEEYETLRRCAEVLQMFYEHGIDKWEGFGPSMNSLMEINSAE